ncbi:MAG: hypothetical protein IJJ23_05850, partial [Clostridia bacterium]|nr:hypothetical protein [Clostridia bacterium]
MMTRDEEMEMVMEAIHDLNEKIDALRKPAVEDEAPEEEEEEVKLTGLDAVEAAIKERMTDSDEEKVEVDPEVLNDEEPEEVKEEAEVIESDDEKPEEEIEVKEKTADRAISMAMLRAIKPIIAQMPKAQRTRACDALTRAVKKASSQKLPGGYGSLLKRKKTMDAAALMESQRAFGENCRKRNPHVKK